MRRSDDQHSGVSQLGGVRIGVPFGALRERSSLLALGLAQAGSHGRCRLGISLKISSAAILVIIGLYRFGGGHCDSDGSQVSQTVRGGHGPYTGIHAAQAGSGSGAGN